MKVFFDTLKDAVLLEGTNIFSYTYHYDIVLVDDGKGALDCLLCFPFIPKSPGRGAPGLCQGGRGAAVQALALQTGGRGA